MNPSLFDWNRLVKVLKLEQVKNEEGSEWLNACCPIHRDRRPSFGINKSTGVYNCYVCGTGNIVTLLSTILGVPLTEAKEQLEAFSSSPLAFASWLQTFDAQVGEAGKRLRSRRNSSLLLSEGMLKMYVPGRRDYHTLISRGFDAGILSDYEVGYDRVLKRNTFPIRNKEGRFSGLVGRSTRTTSTNRWKVYWDTRIREQLYNVHNALDRQNLLITEGPLDVLRAIQHDYPREAVVGIFSATPTKTQIEMIRSLNPKSLIMGLDNDEAGSIGTVKLYEAFISELPILQIEFSEGVKDLGETNYTQFWRMMERKHSPIIRKIAGISAYKIGFS